MCQYIYMEYTWEDITCVCRRDLTSLCALGSAPKISTRASVGTGNLLLLVMKINHEVTTYTLPG